MLCFILFLATASRKLICKKMNVIFPPMVFFLKIKNNSFRLKHNITVFLTIRENHTYIRVILLFFFLQVFKLKVTGPEIFHLSIFW